MFTDLWNFWYSENSWEPISNDIKHVEIKAFLDRTIEDTFLWIVDAIIFALSHA